MLHLPVIAFIVSAAVGFFTIRWAHLHAQFTADRQEDGSHKIHSVMVPRVGGFGIFVGWMAGLVAAVAWSALPGPRALTWLAAVSVVFIAGLTEDLTKKVSPRDRLQATLISALLGAWLLGATLNRLDNGLLDLLFIYPPVAILVTAVAVGGVAHAVNVIDGLNGLAGSICLMALAALGWLWLWSMPAASLWLRVQVEQQNPARSIPALPNAPAIVVLGGGVSPPQPERPDPDLRAAADRIGRADGGGMTRFKGRGREMGCCAWRYKLRGRSKPLFSPSIFRSSPSRGHVVMQTPIGGKMADNSSAAESGDPRDDHCCDGIARDRLLCASPVAAGLRGRTRYGTWR